MRFLGTAAADLLPAPLCKCPICTEARKDPALNRYRCSFLLDDENLIDCGPELAAASMRFGLDLTELKNVFITHTHSDHFCTSNAGFIKMSGTRDRAPVDLYISHEGLSRVMRTYQLMTEAGIRSDATEAVEKEYVRFHAVDIGVPFYAGGYAVVAVPTTHPVSGCETAINYRFSKDGMSLLYACDTGIYLPEALEILRGSRVDKLVMEGTWGNRTDISLTSHLNAYAFVDQLDVFRKLDIIREDTKIYCTHINHKHSWNHEAYQTFFDNSCRFDVTVARDGMEI